MGVRVRPREDDEDVGLDPLRGPPLVAVDDPLVASCCASGAAGLELCSTVSVRAVVRIIVGSLPAPGAGSIIEKPERSSPATSGRRYSSFWRSVPTSSSRCMFPSSGAATRIAAGPSSDRPACSNAGSTVRKSWPRPPYASLTCGA
jgi:hypothetical protein